MGPYHQQDHIGDEVSTRSAAMGQEKVPNGHLDHGNK